MWPALMFAASRNESVSGRTMMLVVSMITRNGFSHSGAPSGKRWAIVFFGLKLIHRGRPNDRVKIRWLEVLNVYGIIPIKLIIIRIINSTEIIDEAPFSWFVKVRDNCVKMVNFMGLSKAFCRATTNQYLIWTKIISDMFIIINN